MTPTVAVQKAAWVSGELDVGSRRRLAELRVPGRIPIYSYIYDCKNGRLIEVPEVTAAGKAS